jgi:asparagine synthase (glutamine-hydrolysing)
MCGILGQVAVTKTTCDIPTADLQSALNLMQHRGPDDEGMARGARFAFGHRRLSILDLRAHARQPMETPDGALVLTYNGEIYNYKSLKRDLQAKGARFRTTSDTEVLLYGLYYDGIAFIERCNGMFAFAAYDKRTDCCWVARDRLGIKPLYYLMDDGVLTFSSEIKSILRLTGCSRTLNLQAVSSYLSFRYPIGNATFFENLDALSPGTYLTIQNCAVTETRYWDPREAFARQRHDKGEAYYLDALEERLTDAVRKRMVADVPIGAYLSGGVDSSAIASIMAGHSSHPVKSFTIGFREKGYDEFDYARVVAEQYQTDHHEIVLGGDDYFRTMVALIGYKDAPLSVPNEVPLYEMSKELKKYITVVLSGEGADELFGGYGRIFRSTDDFDKAQLAGQSAVHDAATATFCAAFGDKYGVPLFQRPVDHFLHNYRYTDLPLKRALLNLDVDTLEQGLVGQFEDLFASLPGETYRNKALYTFEKLHLLGLLGRVDMTTMATSVEARVPFVDHTLVEFAFGIPDQYKLRWLSADAKRASRPLLGDAVSETLDTPKWILKKACEPLLPKTILYRKKMGFPVPLDRWFGDKFNDFARDILLGSHSRERGLLNTKNLEIILDKTDLGTDHPMAMKMWMLVNLELFLRRYFDAEESA